MKIQDNLVWDKHSGDFIGYVDYGDTEVNYATLKNAEEIASHVLIFLIRDIVNPLKFVVANFATTRQQYKFFHYFGKQLLFWRRHVV